MLERSSFLCLNKNGEMANILANLSMVSYRSEEEVALQNRSRAAYCKYLNTLLDVPNILFSLGFWHFHAGSAPPCSQRIQPKIKCRYISWIFIRGCSTVQISIIFLSYYHHHWYFLLNFVDKQFKNSGSSISTSLIKKVCWTFCLILGAAALLFVLVIICAVI